MLESPEPISLSREVTLQLIQHVRVWVPPHPVPPPRPRPVAAPKPLLVGGMLVTPDPAPDPVAQALSSMTFAADQVIAPSPLVGVEAGDQFARILAIPGRGARIDIYDLPTTPTSDTLTPAAVDAVGARRETLTVEQAALQPGYSALAQLPPGTAAVVHSGGVVGPIVPGHWTYTDVDIPVTTLTNGDETRLLILSGTSLDAGSYSLNLVLDRDRWPVSTASADPEQHYHDHGTIALIW